MRTRQTDPELWLIIKRDVDRELWKLLRRLPRRSGILLVNQLAPSDQRRLRNLAHSRGYIVSVEGRGRAFRVHSLRELTRALLSQPRWVLISPIYETRTHPGWTPLPRMRAAALARLSAGKAVALGGMNAKRYRHLAALGFKSWAGISAFRT